MFRALQIVSVSSLVCLVGHVTAADVDPSGGMLRYPAVSKDRIVFVYANDLWTVSRDGGAASPLASPPGGEMTPRFSPDGKTIAFVGNYEGRRDIYTLPVTGGVPYRVTYHPGSMIIDGWSPDGKIIYTSNYLAGQRRAAQMFTVSPEGGPSERLPVPYGEAGAISPDGTWLAYTPFNTDSRTWKRYAGGWQSDIWLFNLKDHTSVQATDWEGTDSQPMWQGDKLYFMSDAGTEHKLNIWVYDTRSRERKQVTHFTEWDVKWPSIGPGDRGQGEIVFQNGPSLYLLDLRAKSSREVKVTIPGDRPKLMDQDVDASAYISNWSISPSAKRVAVEARGDLWTLPAKDGSPRDLTRTSGVAERDAAWSPDGQWIAYFSDATGEYELYITQSDGRGETKQLTMDNGPFKFGPQWSPDSKYITFTDKTSTLWLHTIESGETKKVDQDPWGNWTGLKVSWSHDSRWMAYPKSHDDPNNGNTAIWVYNVEKGETDQLTSGYFADASPTFDRKGDWLFFVSSRSIGGPLYSDLDQSWIYNGSQILLAAPLRADVKDPWLPKSDEETWKKDDKKKDEAGKDEDTAGDDDKSNGEGKSPAAADDGVTGSWEGTVHAGENDGDVKVTLTLALAADHSVTGTVTSSIATFAVTGTYDPAGHRLTLSGTDANIGVVTFDLEIKDGTMTGVANTADQSTEITLQRTSHGGDGDNGEKADKKKEEAKPVEIEAEGFESRAIQIPVPAGDFGMLAVNDKDQLLFVRQDTPGSSATSGIKLFDLKDDKKQEQSVAAGARGFDITPDGKKILIPRGGSATIQNASAGASGEAVPTSGMDASINPRAEWKQLVIDAWRIQRDFFYVKNMHGVDWPKMRDHYLSMVDDATCREDVSFIISELISELNIGHAYYFGGDTEPQPSSSVGTLGCDFELDPLANAYRISKIIQAGPWDVDGRGPLSRPGVDVKEGDYLLEVNGVPVDPTQDVYKSFQGLAGRTITLTVSENATRDDKARDVVIEPMGDDGALRYRAWIEAKRKYVDEKTDGRVGYIHVPDTGVNGQNELVRQFYAQTGKEALIIDERWNGGGQIPTRFIEMLNRPVTNYWARRDNMAWKWPPDSHSGPKCMLINGPSGSGGDMFPWLFRFNKLGPLIGTRTWGGLVGISGNPALIDGGYTSVPTFGFYTTEGKWDIEGHGVDPDYKVVDDPALMVDGGDPQLDKAIELMLKAADEHGFKAPQRPMDPDRSGIGPGTVGR